MTIERTWWHRVPLVVKYFGTDELCCFKPKCHSQGFPSSVRSCGMGEACSSEVSDLSVSCCCRWAGRCCLWRVGHRPRENCLLKCRRNVQVGFLMVGVFIDGVCWRCIVSNHSLVRYTSDYKLIFFKANSSSQKTAWKRVLKLKLAVSKNKVSLKTGKFFNLVNFFNLVKFLI